MSERSAEALAWGVGEAGPSEVGEVGEGALEDGRGAGAVGSPPPGAGVPCPGRGEGSGLEAAGRGPVGAASSRRAVSGSP